MIIILSNKIKKGLLLVVLFCFFAACQSNKDKTPDDLVASTTIPPIAEYLLPQKKEDRKKDTLIFAEIQQLKEGDILLRKGFGVISDFIADYLDEEYKITHCGFVRFLADSTIQILHTVSNDDNNGMLVESLDSYVKKSKKGSLIAVRLKQPDSTIATIMQKATILLDQKVAFDMGFDDHDNSKLYCAEMMRDVFKETIGEDIIDKRTTKKGLDVLSMNNFLDSTHFQIIFNHFDDSTQINQ